MHFQLGYRQPDYAQWLDHQPLLHHLRELGRDDEHGQVLVIPDLHVQPDRLSGALLMSSPRLAPHRAGHPHGSQPAREVHPPEPMVHVDGVLGVPSVMYKCVSACNTLVEHLSTSGSRNISFQCDVHEKFNWP